jgi:hypothetical protein
MKTSRLIQRVRNLDRFYLAWFNAAYGAGANRRRCARYRFLYERLKNDKRRVA